MEYQDNLALYLNLSRKELQGLCKKYNLPSNRSNTQLAKKLASLFKKKSTYPAVPMGRSRSFIKPPSCKSFSADTRPKGKSISSGEAVRDFVGAYERIANSSKTDASKMLFTTKESGGGYRIYSPTRIQFGSSDCMHNVKACDIGANSVHGCTSNNEITEGFGFSTSEPGIKPSISGDAHRAQKVPQRGSWCPDTCFSYESGKSPTVRSHGQRIFSNTVSNSETHLISSGHPRFSECSTKVGFLTSNASSAKETPSFEFFVMSEEGINLYVDLNSSSAEWITSLKDEVCIDQKIQHQSLGSLSNCARNSSNIGQHMKALASESCELNLQVNEAEVNTGCTNSSLSSVVSENCQSELYPPDATVVSSGSFILTSSSNPSEISCLLKNNQGLSSHCIAYSKFGVSKIVDGTPPSQEQALIHQDSIDASFRTIQSNILERDVTSTSKADENLCAGSTGNLNPMECQSLKFQNTDFDNVEVRILHNTMLTACEKDNLPTPINLLNNTKASNDGVSDNHIAMEHMDFERGSSCGNLEVSCPRVKSSNSCQPGSFVGLASGFNENLKKNIPLKGEQKSECSYFPNSLDKVSKRSCSPEIYQGKLNKRHESDGCNKNETLSSSKSSARENFHDLAVFPRRSSRLHSK